MTTRLVLATTIALVSIFISCGVAESQTPSTKEQECSKFVQKFYSWYSAKANQQDGKPSPIQTALQEKAYCFSPDLIRQLKDDLKASAKSPGEIVGLDFDPILNAQDVATPYKVGKVTTKNGVFYVDVYGTWNGVRSKKPDVTPELLCVDGKWIFKNFDYQATPKSDLLSVLKILRAERASSK